MNPNCKSPRVSPAVLLPAPLAVVHWLVLVLGLLAVAPSPSRAQEPETATATRLEAIFKGSIPQGIDDLRAMERHVQQLSERVLAASVGVQVGAAQGSGVIVTPEGHVLTAAHVIGKSGRIAQIYLPDGQRVAAKTLGTFKTMDAGLLKLESPPGNRQQWPHVPMGDSTNIALGQWCLATGHPGGIQDGRQPSVRLGRVLAFNPTNAISTDCTLIGGDSGGPLFDMEGKVIGVHSRIGGPLTANLHVPINTYHEQWSRLERGDNWGYIPGHRPFIGVQGVTDSPTCRLARVFPNSPAEQAGLQVDDVVLSFAGHAISDFEMLRSYVEDQEPGSRVAMEIQRGNQRFALEIVVGRVRE